MNCGCYGYTKARLGGTDESYYMHKASIYYNSGKIKDDGSFDWDYYYKTRDKGGRR